MSVRRQVLRGVCACTAALALAMSTGCMQFRDVGLNGQLEATNREGTRTFVPNYVTSAYQYRDENSADLYFSELPEEWFTGSGAKGGKGSVPPGSILHVHLFLSPSAGSTPIDVTACNAVFVNLIMTGERVPGAGGLGGTGGEGAGRMIPEMGLYAGGGFLLTDGDPGDSEFGGSIDHASHRLSRSTHGFVDMLGTGYLSGTVTAPLNEGLAKAMRARLDELVDLLPPVVIEKEGVKAKGEPME